MKAHRVAMFLLLVVFAGCRDSAPEETPEASGPAPTDVAFDAGQIAHGGVHWSNAEVTTIADVVDLPGRLAVDEDHTARLGPALAGRVVDIGANLGDHVRAGQVLVTLQSEEGSARRADLAKATAAVTERTAAFDYARASRERAERLLALKAGSAQDVERGRTDEAAAKAALDQARADEEHARAALAALDVDSATGQLTLRSPIAGTVVTRAAQLGAVVQAGAPALVVTELSTLWLEFGAPEDLTNQLTTGRTVRVTVPGLGGLDARILGMGGAVDADTRLVPVRAAVKNAAGRLRPEMLVTVHVDASPSRPAVLLPDDAVQLLDNQPVVFIARPDGQGGARFVRRAVTTGASRNGRTPVLAGLEAGDLVVTGGAFAVKSAFARDKMAHEG